MKQVIIIGAGPAGLAAGFKLSEQNLKPIILEKDSQVGGLSRTVKYKGYYFDIGGHRFFTKNKLIFDWWHSILRGNFVKKSRFTRIYYNGKFFNYPILISNVFSNFGLFNSLPLFFSYLKSRIFPYKEEETFEKWVTNRFGNRLYQIFFKNYTEKLWGMPCSQISSDWAAQRIKGLSFSSTLHNALFRGKRNTIKTLIREFYFPRQGAGMMYEEVASRIRQSGGIIKLDSEVVEIRHRENRITSVVCKDVLNGSLFEIEGEDFCSSMPIDLLVSCLNPAPEERIAKLCNCLKHRSLLLVYLILDRKDLFKDDWIYIHSPELKVGRIQNYKNWSPEMVAEPDKSSLALEYFCSAGDEFWQKSDKELMELAIKELERLQISCVSEIRDGFVKRIPYAYPVYDKNYKEPLGAIKDYLGRFSNLQCIGRSGMFRYNNMDHSILTGFLAAENIFGAKNDLWSINVEQSYHEELEENSATSFA